MLCLWMSLDTTEAGKTKLSTETRDAKKPGCCTRAGNLASAPRCCRNPKKAPYVWRFCSCSREGYLATIQLGRAAKAVQPVQAPGRAVEPLGTEQPANTKRSGRQRPARPFPTSPSGPRLLFVKNNTSQIPAVTDWGEKPHFPAGRHPRQLQGLCPLQILQDTSCSLIALAWRAHLTVQPPQQGKLWSLLRAPELKSL